MSKPVSSFALWEDATNAPKKAACFECASAKARADQLFINCKWLVAQLDEIHAALCPGHIGTWQDRAQKAVDAAKSIAQTKNV